MHPYVISILLIASTLACTAQTARKGDVPNSGTIVTNEVDPVALPVALQARAAVSNAQATADAALAQAEGRLAIPNVRSGTGIRVTNDGTDITVTAQFPVTSVNEGTGDVSVTAESIGAATTWYVDNSIAENNARQLVSSNLYVAGFYNPTNQYEDYRLSEGNVIRTTSSGKARITISEGFWVGNAVQSNYFYAGSWESVCVSNATTHEVTTDIPIPDTFPNFSLRYLFPTSCPVAMAFPYRITSSAYKYRYLPNQQFTAWSMDSQTFTNRTITANYKLSNGTINSNLLAEIYYRQTNSTSYSLDKELHADTATNLIWRTVYSNGWVWLQAYTNTPAQ